MPPVHRLLHQPHPTRRVFLGGAFAGGGVTLLGLLASCGSSGAAASLSTSEPTRSGAGQSTTAAVATTAPNGAIAVTTSSAVVTATGAVTSSGAAATSSAATSAPAATLAASTTSVTANTAGAKLPVVAAENFWGSIAGQLGGERVQVTSIISNPDTDPHAYEPKPTDARLFATARYVIVNGAGYDPWAPKLLAANPVPGRTVLTVGDLVGKKDGDNPHLWYNPDYVATAIDQITADFKTLAPADAAYFDQQHTQFDTVGLKTYHDLIQTIKQRYAGTPVSATESIFVYQAGALGLDLITPPGFMQATNDGDEPTAADKATFTRQIATHQIKVFVNNKQNETPDTTTLKQQAQAAGIPVVDITETLDPATATFQGWQGGQLLALEQALAKATGR